MNNYEKMFNNYNDANRQCTIAMEAIVAHLNEVLRIFSEPSCCKGDYLEEFYIENGKIYFSTY